MLETCINSEVYKLVLYLNAVAVAGSDQPGAGAGLRLSPRGMFCFML